MTANQDAQYDIFIFNNRSGRYYESLVDEWTTRREQNPSETFQQTLEYVSGRSIYASVSTTFGEYLHDSAEPEMVEDVEDRGLWYYFAVPKAGVSGDVKQGGFDVIIDYATAYIDWKAYVNDQVVTAGTEFPAAFIPPNASCPAYASLYTLSPSGAKEYVSPSMSSDSPKYSDPVLNSSGLYEVTLVGIEHSADKPNPDGSWNSWTDEYYNKNYKLSSENRTFTYRLAGS